MPFPIPTEAAMIAQEYLASLGFYTGEVDGKWGPISQAAAAAKWLPKSTITAAATAGRQTVPGPQSPYDLAKRYIGTREIPGKEHNPLIVRWLRSLNSAVNDDETAWCAAFVNAMARECGFESTGKLNARSFLDVGQPVTRDAARPGDVVALWRGSKSGWKGHVAFLDHDARNRGLLYLLGGNQNNQVNITAYPDSQLLGFRRLRTLESLQGKTANTRV